jgi:hypothetical protein
VLHQYGELCGCDQDVSAVASEIAEHRFITPCEPYPGDRSLAVDDISFMAQLSFKGDQGKSCKKTSLKHLIHERTVG